MSYFLRNFKRYALGSASGYRAAIRIWLRRRNHDLHRGAFGGFFTFDAYQSAQRFEKLKPKDIERGLTSSRC